MKKLLHERLRVHRGGNDVFHCDNGKSVLALWPSEADAIALEIEKYYDPKPRDPEGNPVHKDMEVEGGVVSHWSVSEDGSWTIFDNDYEEIQCGDKDEPIRLPEPKMLDADGVEIKVGDKVYLVPGKHCGTFPLRYYMAGVEYTVVENKSLSHKADGRICISRGDFVLGFPMPEQVTHCEPDSLEKLRDDIYNGANSSPAMFVVKSWADRLTAIMERDA